MEYIISNLDVDDIIAPKPNELIDFYHKMYARIVKGHKVTSQTQIEMVI